MIDVLLDQWIEALQTPNTTLLTVRVVDMAGNPVPNAHVRIVEEGEVHIVNDYTGAMSLDTAYPPDGSELTFPRGTTLNLVASGPDHAAASAVWVSPGGRHDDVTIALRQLEMNDFLEGADFAWSLDNLEKMLVPGEATTPLVSAFGRTLVEDARLGDVIAWTNLAMDQDRAEFRGAEYVARTWRLHGVRAVAANREWYRLYDPETSYFWTDFDRRHAVKRRAERLARDWAEYAQASHTDDRLAIELCRAVRAVVSGC